MNKACVLANAETIGAAMSSGVHLISQPADFGDGKLIAWLAGEHVLPGSMLQQIVIDGDYVRFAYDLDT